MFEVEAFGCLFLQPQYGWSSFRDIEVRGIGGHDNLSGENFRIVRAVAAPFSYAR